MNRSVRRNDPCPCGSGLKYKKCCMQESKIFNDEDPASELLASAYKKLSDREWEEALALFEKALPSSKSPHTIYEAIASCFDGMDDCWSAMAAYERALESCPRARRPTIVYRYAATKARCKLWDEAYDAFQEYKRLVRGSEEEAGVDIFLEMIKRIQNGEVHENWFESNIQLRRAFTAMEEERFEDAAKRLERACELEPENAVIYFNLGVAYTFLKKDDKALQTFQTCVDIDPKAAEAYYNMGQIYLLQKKDFSRALSCFSRAASVRPDYIGAHHQKGKAYELLGYPEKALECWERTIELDPDNKMARYNIGRVKNLLKKNNATQATSEEHR